MVKSFAWVLAGAVLATAGAAHAQGSAAAPQTSVADRNAVRAETPWYERFTTSSGLTETLSGSDSERTLAPTWRLNDHWGVTVDVREGQRLDRRVDSREDQTAVGAYYQFTPSVRVGGEVSVSLPQSPALAPMARDDKAQPSAGVRLESAFRF